MSVDHLARQARCTRCGTTSSWPRELDIGWPETWSAWYAFRSQGVYLSADETIHPQHLLCEDCSAGAYEFFVSSPAHAEGS